MKRGTRQHPKFKALCSALGIPEYAGVGLLESLWMTVEEFQDDGAIGRWSDRRIAGAIGWDRDAGQLVMFLVECELVDKVDGADRLVIHDWLSHCSSHVWDRVKKRVQRARASGIVVPSWLGAMTDKASAERSRNAPGEDVGGRRSAVDGPEESGTDQTGQRRPSASGGVRQRPAASGLSDPNPRPKTQDLKPKTNAAAATSGAEQVRDQHDMSTEAAAAGVVVMALPVLEGEAFEVRQGLIDSFQREFADLWVEGELKTLATELGANPGKRKEHVAVPLQIRGWLKTALRNPNLRAKRPSIADSVVRSGPTKNAAQRMREEVLLDLNGQPG